MSRVPNTAASAKPYRTDPRVNFSALDGAVLLDTNEASAICGLSPHTLKAWRFQGQGPPAIRLGRALRYRVADLRLWLTERS